jgi:hypothetical protein
MPVPRTINGGTGGTGKIIPVSQFDCGAFALYKCDSGRGFVLNKHLLRCLFDVPLVSAAGLLGVHKNTLGKIKASMGVPEWPFREVMCGTHYGLSKDEIVRSRDSLIADMESDSERGGTDSFRRSLEALRAAREKARFFWNMAGMGLQRDDKGRLVGAEGASSARKKRRLPRLSACKGKKSVGKEGAAKEEGAGKEEGVRKEEDGGREVEGVRKRKKPRRMADMPSEHLGSVAAPDEEPGLGGLPEEEGQCGKQEPSGIHEMIAELLSGPGRTLQSEPVPVSTVPVFWPLITEQFNFDPLFVDGVEDELQLGPVGQFKEI